MTQKSKQTVQSQSTNDKETASSQAKLPKNYNLPNDMKTVWFFSMSKAERRSFMLANHQGNIRVKNTSIRDIEQYAESSANRKVGRASVAV